MRQIKFRGKDLNTGDWVYGDLEIHRKDSRRLIHSYNDDGSYNRQYDVEEETIGQFTGFVDRNGNEVYEGDVIYVEFDDGSHGNSIIGWNNDMYCFGIMTDYEYCSKIGEYEPHVLLNFLREAERFEVIGNVSDNPELLKK